MKENERNDYRLDNPDGRMQNVFESRNDFYNDKKNFVNENNVANVREQELVRERTNANSIEKPKATRQPTTNLNMVSGFFATTAVAVAGAVVVAAYVVAASAILAVAELFAVTGDSLTFYVQAYLNDEYSYVARLYSEEKMMEEMPIKEPFIQFYGLTPENSYTLQIIDTKKEEEIVFEKDFTTASEEAYAMSFESWIEESELVIDIYGKEEFPSLEDVTSYTISVFDKKGKSVYKQTFETLEDEYRIPIELEQAETISSYVNPILSDSAGPTADDPVEEEYDEYEYAETLFYVGIVYKLGEFTIGTIQSVSLVQG